MYAANFRYFHCELILAVQNLPLDQIHPPNFPLKIVFLQILHSPPPPGLIELFQLEPIFLSWEMACQHFRGHDLQGGGMMGACGIKFR